MRQRPDKPTVPRAQVRALADRLYDAAVALAEAAVAWEDQIASLPGSVTLLRPIFDYRAAVEAYRAALAP